ncbi:MAG: ferredoxin [Patescibacteria group bacterium]|jgi:ferredoxin
MVKVDQNKCIGCGLCAGLCPETFSMNLDGKAEVIKTQETPGAKDAAASCPVEAISLTK